MQKFSKESIAIVSFFLGVAISGSYVYFHVGSQLEHMKLGYYSAFSYAPACVPRSEGKLDDAQILSGIVAWGETIAPWIDDVAKNSTDDRIKDLYAREAKALRSDAQEARRLFREFTKTEYTPGGTLWYELPKENMFSGVTPDTYRGILRGSAVYAQREVYGAALASQIPEVRDLGERYSQRLSRLVAEISSP